MNEGACGSPEGSVDLLELEIKAVVDHPMWVMGNELKTSGKAASGPSLQLRKGIFFFQNQTTT